MAKKKKSHARAPGMTQISISLPESLVDKIDRLADSDNRNRSNFIATYLEKLATEDMGVAEKPEPFDRKASRK